MGLDKRDVGAVRRKTLFINSVVSLHNIHIKSSLIFANWTQLKL